MDVVANIIELRPNSLERVKEWQERLMSVLTKLFQHYKMKGVVIESWFHLSLRGICSTWQ